MLSIEEIQKHLPAEWGNRSDKEVRKIRDEMNSLADLLLDIYFDKENQEKEVFEKLLEEVKPQFKLDINGDHGIMHWRRVKRIGLQLASGIGADWRVITLFAGLHDARRESDGNDPDHGERAAIYAIELHKKGLLPVNDRQLEQLSFACRHHANRHAKSEDLTIQACWDSDRLDLYRLGEIPDDKFLYTKVAKKRKTRDFVLKLLGK